MLPPYIYYLTAFEAFLIYLSGDLELWRLAVKRFIFYLLFDFDWRYYLAGANISKSYLNFKFLFSN